MLATLEDFERLHGDLTAAQANAVTGWLEGASALVLAEVDAEWTAATVPAAVKAVVVSVAYRAWSNPDALSQSSMADTSLSYTRGGTPDALFLTAAERRVVRRAAGQPNSQSLTLVTPFSGDVSDDDVGDL